MSRRAGQRRGSSRTGTVRALLVALAVAATLGGSACSRSDPAHALAAARAQAAAGDLSRAVFGLQDLVRRHPQDGAARLLLAQLDLDRGDVTGARLALDGLDPGTRASLDAVLVRARLAGAQGHFQEGLDELEAHGAQLDPTLLAVEKARLLSGLGRRHDALEVLSTAHAAAPASVPVTVALAAESAAQGDADSARRLLGQLPASVRDPDALAVLGTLDLRAGALPQATAELESALRASTAAWAPTRRWAVEFELGDAYLAQHDLAAAKKILARLHGEAPGAIGARLLDAQIAMLEGRPRDVVRLLAPIIDGSRADPKLVAMYAHALVEAGEPEQARQAVGALQTRVRAAPSATSWRILGAAQVSVHELAAASASFDAAYRLAPSAVTVVDAFRARLQARLPDPTQPLLEWLERAPHDATVRSLLGEYEQARGESAAAQREYETAVADDPRNLVALNNLAVLLAPSNPNRAEALAREAVRLAPNSPLVQDTLGWILVQRAQLAEALPLLASAARREAGNVTVQFHYAAALARAGREQQARMILETILLSRQDFADRARATQLLDALSAGTAKGADGKGADAKGADAKGADAKGADAKGADG